MAKPDYSKIEHRMHVQEPDGSLRPLPAVSEIVPMLWQGVRPNTYRGYDLVVSCEEFLAKGPMDGYRGMLIHIPMRDDDEFKIPAWEIDCVQSLVVLELEEPSDPPKKILVHCSGGLNRSSLITAIVLKNLHFPGQPSLTPQDAVTLLRAKRDPFCLCNRAFERWVLGEQLPTAETSMFRIPES